MAPIMDSTVSARIESRRKPPLFISPDPSRRYWPSSNSRPISASVTPFTNRARRRLSCPSRARSKWWYRCSAMIMLTSESPRNSSRSLFWLPKLRWVSASSNSPDPGTGSRGGPVICSGRVGASRSLQLVEMTETHHRIHVGNHGGTDFVFQTDNDDIAVLLNLDVFGVKAIDVVHTQALRHQPANVRRGHFRKPFFAIEPL